MTIMADDQDMSEINYEEQYSKLSEENKKLSIDIASLQLSNRSLVNQNRDEKKKVMDCRLQISDLESRLKGLEVVKTELSESQTQAERLRQSLEITESKLASTEKRAHEAENLVKVKDSVIEKHRKFSKELEDKVKTCTSENENLTSKCRELEVSLSLALDRAEECDRLRASVAAKSALLDKLAESSEGISETGLAAANEFFKEQESLLQSQLTEMKELKKDLESNLKTVTMERDSFQEKIDEQTKTIEGLKEECAALETRVKDSRHGGKHSKGDMSHSRLIGPALPPWIMEEKKTDPTDMEKLKNADPATLRARVLDLEGKVHELNQLLTYREDVILRIYQEIQKKASRLDAAEVERSSLSAQVDILKRELAGVRGDGGSRRRGSGAYPPEIEIEIERLRGKRDREYARRKRAEAEMDEMEVELNETKEKLTKLEQAMAELEAAPKPVIHSGDPADKARITELQAAVNQLRMDNEAKRSELFDLRSRFDEKSAQLDGFSSQMKNKDRQVTDLTTELTSTTSQLELANKELETVRCRVVRGGVETDRWQSDLTSVRTSNRLLMRQATDLQERLINTEKQLTEAKEKLFAAKENGVDGVTGSHSCSKCSETVCNGTQDSEKKTSAEIENLKLQCKTLEERIEDSASKEARFVEKTDLLLAQLAERSHSYRVLEARLWQAEKGQVNTLTNSLDVMREKLTSTETELQACRGELTDAFSKRDCFAKEVESLKSDAESWMKKFTDLEAVRADDKVKCAARNAAMTAMENEIEELKARLREAEDRLASCSCGGGTADAAQSEVNALSAQCASLQSELEDQKKCCDELMSSAVAVPSHPPDQCVVYLRRIDELLATLKREQAATDLINKRVSSLTGQVVELETALEASRERLHEATSENRRADREQTIAASTSSTGAQNAVTSPPAKRPRRTRASTAAAEAAAAAPNTPGHGDVPDCPGCAELRRQVEELESEMTETSSKISTSVTELNELRGLLTKATEEAGEMRRQLGDLQTQLFNKTGRLTEYRHTVSTYLEQRSDSLLHQLLHDSGDEEEYPVRLPCST